VRAITKQEIALATKWEPYVEWLKRAEIVVCPSDSVFSIFEPNAKCYKCGREVQASPLVQSVPKKCCILCAPHLTEK
jgi:hypothetical protein